MEIIVDKQESHWIQLRHVEGNCNNFDVIIKWDGCIHVTQHGAWNEDGTPYEMDEGSSQYIHICGDLNQWINVLNNIRDRGIKHFGKYFEESI